MRSCEQCRLPLGTGPDENCSNKSQLCRSCRILDDTSEIQLTPLKRNDLELVLAWRSLPAVYRYFRKQDGPLDWDEHLKWYETRESDRHDFIIYFGRRRVGSINIGTDDSMGVFIGDLSARGQGVATDALRWACCRFETRAPLTAEIHEENEASKRLFADCGFRRRRQDNEWIQYVYEP